VASRLARRNPTQSPLLKERRRIDGDSIVPASSIPPVEAPRRSNRHHHDDRQNLTVARFLRKLCGIGGMRQGPNAERTHGVAVFPDDPALVDPIGVSPHLGLGCARAGFMSDGLSRRLVSCNFFRGSFLS